MRVRMLTILLASAMVLAASPASAQAPPDLAIPDGTVEELVFPQPELHTHFVSDFGFGRADGRTHQGNDLMGEKGDPVVAILSGTVTAMRNGPRSGYYVVIEHDNGWKSWYMHLNNDIRGDGGRGGAATAFAEGLAVGQRVEAGQVIGYVGDSGNAEHTAPHTHFELHINGRAVDPYPYLVAAWNRLLESIEQARVEAVFERGAF